MPNYEANIRHALSETRNYHSVRETRDLSDLKLVIFSDHHRGVRDGADDFFQCQAAYHAALGYYLEAGYELFLLGDVEELWEAAPEAVTQAYESTLRLEGQFTARGGLKRFFGNHDDLWRNPDAVAEHLGPYFEENAHIYEGLELTIQDDGHTLGPPLFRSRSSGYRFIRRLRLYQQSLCTLCLATPTTHAPL